MKRRGDSARELLPASGQLGLVILLVIFAVYVLLRVR
jgi:flagellar biogenesis protein FliO